MQNASAAQLADRPDKLTRKIKLGFGVGDLGGNLFFTIIGFYLLNFLTDSFGLAAGAAGTALFIGKMWDAVTDPAVGYLSDRTHSKWGRRRPYMAVGAVFLFVFMILMFSSPNITSQPGKFAWVATIYCLLNTAYTLVNIPYSALTPELTGDFDERTTLNGYRMSFAVVGTLIGAGAFLPLVGVFGGGSTGFIITGAVMGAIMALVTMITVMTVKEQLGAPVKSNVHIIRSYLQVMGMKSFLTILLPYACHITGITIIQASLIYFFRYIYGEEGLFSIALLFLLVMCLALIPVWVVVSRTIGKKMSYNIGMLIFLVAVVVFFFVGHLLPVWFSFVVFAVAGIGYATNYVMPYSIVPDVVEYDFAKTGSRREGVFYGMLLFSSKVGQAFALALTGWILAAFQYVQPTEAVAVPPQSATAILGIRLLTGPIPALFFLIGVIIMSFYPISRAVYDEIMEKVERRERVAAEGGGDSE
jgi:GPH family glycoside/pentoside/hexuronide:cation symporter